METSDAYALFRRGRDLLAEGHPHQAAMLLEQAAQAEPEKTSIREALARALYNSGQTEKARDQFAAVVELDPSNDYAHFGLGLCHAKSGEVQMAKRHLKIAVAMNPEITHYREALDRLAG